jgi:DNA-binding transcriptional ArsR family regulator
LNRDLRLQRPANFHYSTPQVAGARIAIHRRIDTRARVAELLADGKTRLETARILGLSKSTVTYHARRLGLEIDDRFNRRYDWAEVQRYYDAGHSITECQEKFGFARGTWSKAWRRGAVRSRPQAIPIDELLVAGRRRSRDHVKRRLLSAGLKENRCEQCGIESWQDRPLSVALHHVNGDGKDNRLENLLFLCPNCHSQTENFGSKKWAGRARLRRELEAIGATALGSRRRLPLRGTVT